MKKKRKKLRFYKLFMLFSIIFIVFIIYFYNEKLLDFKLFSSSIFNLNDEKNFSKNDTEISELKKEIKELEQINNINANLNYEYINAKVIKRNNSYWNESLTINVGKINKVKKGAAVTYNNTLIGIVSHTNKNTSQVSLITSNSNNYISAKFTIDGTEYFGIIKNYNIMKNELYLENVIGDFNVNNEEVVTSGLEENILSGIFIGYIKDIKKDKYNLSSKIIIKPNVNYNNIKYVKVINK